MRRGPTNWLSKCGSGFLSCWDRWLGSSLCSPEEGSFSGCAKPTPTLWFRPTPWLLKYWVSFAAVPMGAVKARSALRVPVVNFITDFGFHPFWAHRGIDLNLAVPPSTAEAVGHRTGRLSLTCGPLVSPEFVAAPGRRAIERARLGLQQDDLGVLISSGSWGVGALKETFELVANEPGSCPS